MESDRGIGIEQTWEKRARCKEADPDIFFPYLESEEQLEKIKKEYCNLCAVRQQCLASALVNRDYGYRAGTSTAQRRAMARTRTRAKCPVCGTVKVVAVHPYQICVHCGTSWKADGPPPQHDVKTVLLPHQVSEKTVTVPDPRRLLS